MKKILALLLIGLTLMATCFAEDEKKESEKTEYEKVLLQKGSLLIKEFEKIDSFQFATGYGNTIDSEICTLTDAQTKRQVYAFKMSHYYYNSKYDSGTSTGVLDAAEIASIISTFNYIKTEFDKLSDTSTYKEIQYTSNGGLSLGAYQGGKEKNLFIKLDYKDTIRIDFSKLDDVINYFTAAQEKINQKMKK